MKVPTREGRVAWLVGMIIAVASAYLLFVDTKILGRFGDKLAIAGVAAFIGLAQYYRRSLHEVAEIGIRELDGCAARAKRAFEIVKVGSSVLAVAAVVAAVASSNYGVGVPKSWALPTIIVALAFVGLREGMSALLSGSRFIRS